MSHYNTATPSQLRLAKLILWLGKVRDLITGLQFDRLSDMARLRMAEAKLTEPTENTLVIAVVREDGCLLSYTQEKYANTISINRLIVRALKPYIKEG